MPGSYAPKWISLSDALEYLDFLPGRRRARFKKLQSPVRDRAIVVRLGGAAAERERHRLLQINADPDYAPQIDDQIRAAIMPPIPLRSISTCPAPRSR